MKLTDIHIPVREVPVPGTPPQSITLRGLSADDLEQIFDAHAQDLTRIFKDYVAEHGMVLPDPLELIRIMRKEIPTVVAHMIALANDTPKDEIVEAVAKVGKLPGSTQASAAVEVLKLTFHSVDELKKILFDAILGMEVMADLLNGLTERVEQVNGIPASEASGTSDGSSGARSAPSSTGDTPEPATTH